MMMLHPVFAGAEQLISLRCRQRQQDCIRGVGQGCQLLAEIGG